MEPQRDDSLQWLYNELLDEYSRTGSFSTAQEFLPILDSFERDEILRCFFWEALSARQWSLAEHCLANGFSLTPQGVSAGNPLHTAMLFCGDCPDVIAWLLTHGAELERRDLSYGNSTPLIHATGAGLDDIVELLLQHGADVNASTLIDDDQTSLMIAVETENERGVRRLLSHGAEIARKDRWGRDAIELAETKGCLDICRLLREKSP